MIIKYDNPAGQLAGKVGGHYLQTSAHTPSLRTKRIRGNDSVPRNMPSRGYLGYIARQWQTLSAAQKATFHTYGLASSVFAHLDSANPLFAYWVYIAVQQYLHVDGQAFVMSVSNGAVLADGSLTFVSLALSPLRVRLNVQYSVTGGRSLLYAQINMGSEVDPLFRAPRFIIGQAANANNTFNVDSELQALYGPAIQPVSITCQLVRLLANGNRLSVGSLSQAYFPSSP